jgi:hypothetical protein
MNMALRLIYFLGQDGGGTYLLVLIHVFGPEVSGKSLSASLGKKYGFQ